jgi:hypothetical protein
MVLRVKHLPVFWKTGRNENPDDTFQPQIKQEVGMNVISEVTQRKWERRLRSFWLIGGSLFIGLILVARPLTESFEAMRQVVPLTIVCLFSALMASGVIWAMLQLALAQRGDRDLQMRSSTFSFRRF